ncbi:hypothetical protein [Saccharopolyspora dendranthemae]|uniref:hypothetical protein n=1 Tax=Saccharopolyspora dendranthemae TaxID=1181886 RepID=UPI00164941ED|nr:hypothetical protein [Saccharopolyspora dendranthemae]
MKFRPVLRGSGLVATSGRIRWAGGFGAGAVGLVCGVAGRGDDAWRWTATSGPVSA